MLRAYAFVWFMRPDWLGNPSQVELSSRLKVSKQTLGKVVNQLRNRFEFYVAGMRGDDARRKFAAHAKAHAQQLADARRRAHQAKAPR
jgi:tRNA-dihydrouridine synthase